MFGGSAPVTANQRTIEAYMDGFRRTDRALILSCLTDDVEWVIPGFFRVQGKEDFDRHIVDEGFAGNPDIVVTRVVEADGIVVAEGTVRTRRSDGTRTTVVFCDLFEMEDGRIRRLTSYLMEIK
jgi:ketosteroid isomerase-like protein